MSDINVKRAFVYDMYPHKGWHKRVERMSDAQILAIFLREQNKAKEESSEENTDEGLPF